MLAKQLLRVPVNVPGHSGVLWVALFVICRGLVDKRGTGVLLGLVAGLLAQFAGFGHQGPFEWTKWLAAGAVLELLTLVLPGDLRELRQGGRRRRRPAPRQAGGADACRPHPAECRSRCCSSASGWSATTHVLFGVLGGLLGALALRQLRKVPFLDAQARGT